MLIAGFIAGLTPEPRLTVSEWANTKRHLDSVSSAEPGLYRTARTPYWEEPMNHLSVGSAVQKIVIIKCTQIGATEVGNNFIGYIVDCAPGPIMVVNPTVDMVKRNSKMRITPMIDASPSLAEKFKPSKAKDSSNTISQKDFIGGTLVLTGANSGVGLRSMPVRFLLLDEVDAYPNDVDGEGSPIILAEKRTSTYPNRKILIISTPTIEGRSLISNEFFLTDQRYYHVPCPVCGEFQKLVFAQLRWEGRDYENTYYECAFCKGKIAERHKGNMLSKGKWIASKPELKDKRTVGYHINALYSPFGWKSWAEITEEWVNAQGDDAKMKAFFNTVLGETYKEITEAPEWEAIYNRAMEYLPNTLMRSVAFLTAGIDVQSDRVELEIVGWMPQGITQSVDYRVLVGDTTKKDVWNELDKILSETWSREDGAQLPLRLACIDSGYNTSTVYRWSKKHTFSRVIPIKGSDSLNAYFSSPKIIDTVKHGQKIGKQKVWHIGSSFIKSEIYANLRQSVDTSTGEVPYGYCYMPQRETHYFKGLTAEVQEIVRNKKGYLSYVWVKRYPRNEPLDCRVYARAAAAIIGCDRWSNERWITETNVVQSIAEKKITKTIKKSNKDSYWNRNK
ncbi:phage terminase large subunit family protein [Chitinophaga skermanii]|uniref:phage terminase large subunit family protein n=1 Tax=Chitinophaga skermanii TaxID=331697 RepID=UPI001314AF26|nr:phage terminase large subunit family protein [Chitinophaga skermanii]